MKLYKLFLLLLVFIITGCSAEDDYPPLCPDGDCNGKVYLPYPQDSNGVYRVDLDFEGEYLPRFDIFIEADNVDPYYFYNDMGVIEGTFESSSYWTLPNGVNVDIVQSTSLYLNNSAHNNEYTPSLPNRKWAKRIVGPFPPSFEGELITINAEIYWDGGSNYDIENFQIKFIIE